MDAPHGITNEQLNAVYAIVPRESFRYALWHALQKVKPEHEPRLVVAMVWLDVERMLMTWTAEELAATFTG
jgi:hypothetical protein